MAKSVLGHDPFARPPNAGESSSRRGRRQSTGGAKPVASKKTKRSSPAKAKTKKKIPVAPPPAAPEPAVDRIELLSTPPAWNGPGRLGQKVGDAFMKLHADEVDGFGFDPVFWDKVAPFFNFLFDSFWRVEVRGIEHLPTKGQVLLVANHSGALPYDGIMIKMAMDRHAASTRPVRFLVEDFVFHFPFLGPFINRIGGVRACQDNARRLLDQEQAVVVFPEGAKGSGKPYQKRYQLQRFGRGGFIKLALRSGATVLPVSVVGAEEIHPILSKLKWLARPLGLPFLPVTPTFPWLGPLGALPLPSKWIIRFGPALDFSAPADSDADDPLTVMRLAEQVRSTIQEMLSADRSGRKNVFA